MAVAARPRRKDDKTEAGLIQILISEWALVTHHLP